MSTKHRGVDTNDEMSESLRPPDRSESSLVGIEDNTYNHQTSTKGATETPSSVSERNDGTNTPDDSREDNRREETVVEAFIPGSRKLEELKRNAPVVDGVQVPDNEQQASLQGIHKWLAIILIVLVIVALAVVTPAVIVKNRNSKDDNSSSEKDILEKDQVSSNPTLVLSSSPSINPTFVPSWLPSISPSISPTANPTTAAPTTEKFDLVASLVFGPEDYQNNVVPSDPSSPGWKALDWLAEMDGSNVTNGDDLDRVRQRFALVALYFATGGETWVNQLNFLSDDHECSWNAPTPEDPSALYGVKGMFCTFENILNQTFLILSNNNAIGTIPEEIGFLSSGLTRVDFDSNWLEGSLPSTIDRLDKLEILNLKDNLLGGKLPNSLMNLSNLLYFSLATNTFTGTISSEFIDSFPSLITLYLDNNYISGAIPESFGNSDSLIVLHLDSNILYGTLPANLPDNLQALTYFNANLNFLNGTIPSSYGQFPELSVLTVEQNSLSGTLPPELGNISTLGYLGIGVNSFQGSIPSSFNNLSNLLGFSFPFNQVNGSLPFVEGALPNLSLFFADHNLLEGSLMPFRFLRNLAYLTIQAVDGGQTAGNYFTGTIPTEFCELPLVSIGLGANLLNGTIPECFGNQASLTTFAVAPNNLTGTLPTEFGLLTTLTQIDLSRNKLTGSIPSEIGLLTSLRLSGFFENNFDGFLPVTLSNLTDLTSLTLNYNNFKGTIPTEFGRLQKLQNLQFSTNDLTGKVPNTLQYLTSLHTLTLDRNRFTGDLSFLCDGYFAPNYNHTISRFYADCHSLYPEIVCPCCSLCCSEEAQPYCEIP